MKTNPKRKTAIYCRTAIADEGKIAAQERLLRACAEEHGYDDAILYRDCGAAGNTLDRPALNRLTADIKAGEIGAVLVTSTSRIARNFALVSEWLKILRKHNVKLIAAQDGAEVSNVEMTYRRVGDYLLPDIALSDSGVPLGKYGRMHKAFLKEHRPILYSQILMPERLYPLCREVDEAAQTRLDAIGDPEIAHEIILAELVYR